MQKLTKTITRHRRLLVLPLILAFSSSVLSGQLGDEGQMEQQQSDPAAEVRQQLEQVEQALFTAQEQALEVEAVQEKRDQLQDLINSHIIAANPDMSEVIDRRQVLLNELEDHPELQSPDQQPSEPVMAMIQEYQQLQQQIAPVQQQVFQETEVREAHEDFQATLLAEMERVAPNAPQLMEQREALFQRFQQIQQEQAAPPPAEY